VKGDYQLQHAIPRQTGEGVAADTLPWVSNAWQLGIPGVLIVRSMTNLKYINLLVYVVFVENFFKPSHPSEHSLYGKTVPTFSLYFSEFSLYFKKRSSSTCSYLLEDGGWGLGCFNIILFLEFHPESNGE